MDLQCVELVTIYVHMPIFLSQVVQEDIGDFAVPGENVGPESSEWSKYCDVGVFLKVE